MSISPFHFILTEQRSNLSFLVAKSSISGLHNTFLEVTYSRIVDNSVCSLGTYKVYGAFKVAVTGCILVLNW